MRIVLTGAAGFIGSHLVEALLQRGHSLRLIDNLSTGALWRIEEFLADERVEFIEGDLRDTQLCVDALRGMDAVCHQAALGSVPRSVDKPFDTMDHNVKVFANIGYAAREAGIRRLVYASSSSVYGDNQDLPKQEEKRGKPLSPYAISKLSNELMADNFGHLYGLECIGFRYFNIFGPKQSPEGAYAAVIPLFMQAARAARAARIHGDGLQSRDFTYVANAVQANVLALESQNKEALGKVYNIGCGKSYNLLELWERLSVLASCAGLRAQHGPARAGDARNSLADISRAQKLLGYEVLVDFDEGLKRSFAWFINSQFAR